MSKDGNRVRRKSVLLQCCADPAEKRNRPIGLTASDTHMHNMIGRRSLTVDGYDVVFDAVITVVISAQVLLLFYICPDAS